jgi:hypothetical protein
MAVLLMLCGRIEFLAFHRSFTGLSQGCGTCHSTNTVLFSNTNINYIVVTVIYSLLQYYCNNKYSRKHHYYCLHIFIIAENFWLR